MASERSAAAAPEVFAFDNGVGRRVWSSERQAATLREFGYDGISYDYTNPADLRVWLAELGKQKLKLYALYLGVRLQNAKPFPDGFEESLHLLRGSGAAIWLTIAAAPKPGEGADTEALQRVQEVADLAAKEQLRVALYPHKGLHVATAEQAFALATRSGRANVGVTVNLCHELAAGNGPRLPAIIRSVAPRLTLVSINGATDRLGPAWDNYIKLLSEGDYDVAGILRTLGEVGYRGPIGIQFYNIKGDSRENLRVTMQAWKKLTASLP